MASFAFGRLGLLRPSQEKEVLWRAAFRTSQRKLHILEKGVAEEELERCHCGQEFQQNGNI